MTTAERPKLPIPPVIHPCLKEHSHYHKGPIPGAYHRQHNPFGPPDAFVKGSDITEEPANFQGLRWIGDAVVLVHGIARIDRARVTYHGGGNEYTLTLSCPSDTTAELDYNRHHPHYHIAPISQAVTRDQIEGQRMEVKDGYWHPALPVGGSHRDHELAVLAAIEALLQPLIRQYLVDYLGTTDTESQDTFKARYLSLIHI